MRVIVFILALLGSNLFLQGQAKIFLRDALIFDVNRFQLDDDLIRFTRNGTERAIATKRLLVIESADSIQHFRGHLARKKRYAQPNFAQLYERLSVGMQPFISSSNTDNNVQGGSDKGKLNIYLAYFVDKQKAYEVELHALLTTIGSTRNPTSENGDLAFGIKRYISLLRPVRFYTGFGVGFNEFVPLRLDVGLRIHPIPQLSLQPELSYGRVLNEDLSSYLGLSMRLNYHFNLPDFKKKKITIKDIR